MSDPKPLHIEISTHPLAPPPSVQLRNAGFRTVDDDKQGELCVRCADAIFTELQKMKLEGFPDELCDAYINHGVRAWIGGVPLVADALALIPAASDIPS